MTELILDQCSKSGVCPLNRNQFNETFTGFDLTIQVRSAIDFAQSHNLAFARCAGDQQFVFSRLPSAPQASDPQSASRRFNSNSNSNTNGKRRHNRGNQGKRKSQGSSNRPYGRAF
jgi:hypothetical protein